MTQDHLPQLHTKEGQTGATQHAFHSQLQESEFFVTQSNPYPLTQEPRVLLPGQPGVTQSMPHSGNRGTLTVQTRAIHTYFPWPLEQFCRGYLEQPSTHLTLVHKGALLEQPRASWYAKPGAIGPCYKYAARGTWSATGAGATQQIACKRTQGPHRESHIRTAHPPTTSSI